MGRAQKFFHRLELLDAERHRIARFVTRELGGPACEVSLVWHDCAISVRGVPADTRAPERLLRVLWMWGFCGLRLWHTDGSQHRYCPFWEPKPFAERAVGASRRPTRAGGEP